ncbi:MAG: AI-2E family transporter [bacterium]|nr:AI-2E family transporter [bacterium]
MTPGGKTEFTVSVATLVKIVVVGIIAAALFWLRDIAALVLVSVFLAVLISPVADFCERHRLPRALGIGVVYLTFFGFVGFLFTLLAQPIIYEAKGLATSFPDAWTRVLGAMESLRAFSLEHGLADKLQEFASGLEGKVTAGIFGAIAGVFGGALSFVLVLVLTFYLATHATTVRRTLIGLTSARWQPFLVGVVPRIERKMGSWLRGLLALAVIMSFFVFVGLAILRVEYALLIALLAAFAEIVPYVGPIVALIVAVVLTLLQSPAKALVVLIFFVVLQQMENHLLVPKIMHRAVGVHPVVSLIAILVGARIGGVAGALLAIPIAAGLITFFEEYGREKRQTSS